MMAKKISPSMTELWGFALGKVKGNRYFILKQREDKHYSLPKNIGLDSSIEIIGNFYQARESIVPPFLPDSGAKEGAPHAFSPVILPHQPKFL
ncbi:MAG: hypothetical protein AB7E77_01200 [Desulfobulbus sp.]